METYLEKVLFADILSGQRQDHNVSRQGIMNHQIASHMMDLAIVRDMTEMSIPEATAVQSLIPREAQFINLANKTPNTP